MPLVPNGPGQPGGIGGAAAQRDLAHQRQTRAIWFDRIRAEVRGEMEPVACPNLDSREGIPGVFYVLIEVLNDSDQLRHF